MTLEIEVELFVLRSGNGIGDAALGVVEWERCSSESRSRGVMGLGIPGMYPGNRGDGEADPGRPFRTGEARRTSESGITCLSEVMAVPGVPASNSAISASRSVSFL